MDSFSLILNTCIRLGVKGIQVSKQEVFFWYGPKIKTDGPDDAGGILICNPGSLMDERRLVKKLEDNVFIYDALMY